MPQLLVSFCNAAPRGPVFGVYDFDGDSFAWIPLDAIKDDCLGVDGICKTPKDIWFLPQVDINNASGLARANSMLQTKQWWTLQQTGDAHSLVEHDGGFLITDTQRNRINYISIDGDSITENEFWRCAADDSDTMHVNSVAKLGGEIYVSLFGPIPAGGWGGSSAGQVLNVTTNEVICGGLKHPHTVTAFDDELWWLESKTGAVYRWTKGAKPEIFITLPGYTRGIAKSNEYLYVGLSAKRRTSRSTGMPTADLGTGDQVHSWVYRVHLETRQTERRLFTQWGAEIYDLAVLDSPIPISSEPHEAEIQRLWRLEDNNQALVAELKADVRLILYEEINRLYDQMMAGGQWEQALESLNRMRESDPTNPRWAYLAAFCSHQAGKLEHALNAYQVALDLGAMEFWVRYNRGCALNDLGRFSEAVVDFERASELDPTHEGVKQGLATARSRS